MTMPIILDASTVIAVVTNEAHKPALVRMTRGAELLSPASLTAEIGNAFSAMFKRKRISLEEAQAAVEEFWRIPIRQVPIDVTHALELSHSLRIYAYDAYLIACGLQYHAPLLTLDGGLRNAARQAGVTVPEILA